MVQKDESERSLKRDGVDQMRTVLRPFCQNGRSSFIHDRAFSVYFHSEENSKINLGYIAVKSCLAAIVSVESRSRIALVTVAS